jgi:5-methylcytosine-specific restriction endonuclease McrA
MNQSLVLNRNYHAVHIADSHKVMSMLYTGEAQAVDDKLQCYDFKDWAELSALMRDEDHSNGFVNTITMRIAVPEVVRLTRYDRLPRRDIKFTRHNLFLHYKKKCCYCAKQVSSFEATWDQLAEHRLGLSRVQRA